MPATGIRHLNPLPSFFREAYPSGSGAALPISPIFPFDRRNFLKHLAIAGAATALPQAIQAADALHASKKSIKPSGIEPARFQSLPIGSIRPTGWLKDQLRLQADSLSGHLDETWPDVGPNSGWLGGAGESGERGPYFLDGLTPLAYLLGDARLKAKVQKYIDWTLNNQAAGGMFGPRSNDDWWP